MVCIFLSLKCYRIRYVHLLYTRLHVTCLALFQKLHIIVLLPLDEGELVSVPMNSPDKIQMVMNCS